VASDPNEAVAMTILAVAGLVQMALHPRKTIDLLARGKGWYDDELAARAAEQERHAAHLRAARDQEWPTL
jgi:hypothetical protein